MKFKVTQCLSNVNSKVVEIKSDKVSGSIYEENGKADVRVNSYFLGEMTNSQAKKLLLSMYKSLPDNCQIGDYES